MQGEDDVHRIRVYVDTSGFGGTQDDQFDAPSRRFFERVAAGRYRAAGPGVGGMEAAPEVI